jgi:hypothetical protein
MSENIKTIKKNADLLGITNEFGLEENTGETECMFMSHYQSARQFVM